MFNKKKKKKSNKNEIIIIVVVVILGFLSGIAGQIFMGSYLDSPAYKIPYWSEINLIDDISGKSLIISGARKIIVEQNVKIDEVIHSSNQSIFGIFRKKQASVDTDNEKFNLDNYYNLKEKRGQGVAITSDGWIMTSAFSPNIRSEQEILNDYVIIGKDGKVYEIDKVLRDPTMSFGFIHIVGAKDLNVVEFVDVGETKIGQQILIINWEGESLFTSIISENGPSSKLIKPSDYYDRTFKIANDLPDNFNGGFVFNINGKLISVVNNQGNIKSVDNLYSATKSVLVNGEINRASLGINYINLQDLARVNKEQGKGAFIYEIKKNSSAEKAGLKEGDIITFVNNIELNKDNELNHVLQNYMAGEKISLTYIRDGEKKQIDVMLDEY